MRTQRQKKDRLHDEVRQVRKRICSSAISSALAIAAVFFLIHEVAIARGLLLGACFSIFNFIVLSISVPLTLGQSRSKASMIGLTSIFFRYILLAIPMIVAIKSVSFNFVAVAVGIFSVQIVTLVDHIIVKPLTEAK
ncbi:MAG: ATP synthase subunit I [Thermodesulfobacteriota bacterium]|nr:ATP synthase subunit I [Thermodesulfobacteriota bacterium]